jgi:hypothetical protein
MTRKTTSFSAGLIVATMSILGATACVLAGNYNIVDTGQAGFYNNMTAIAAPLPGQAFYGQDAQYRGNQPSYALSADSKTVYDNNTGLTWMQSPDANLDGAMTYADKLSWTQAQALPATLNAINYGGYSDWRLPTIKQLYSLIDFSGGDPSTYQSTSTTGLKPFLNTNYFGFTYGFTNNGERVIDSQWATSTGYAANPNQMFGVNFADGRIKGYGTSIPNGTQKLFEVLCVRGNTDYGINNFKDNGNSTVTDNATGLMWAKGDSGAAMNWQNALQWAQTKNAQNYLGHSDWRLPNAKELQSIMDYSRSPDTTGSAAIASVFDCTQIIGETGQSDYPWYWSSTTHLTWDGVGRDAVYLAFGRAEGFMDPDGAGPLTGAWQDIHGAGAQRCDPKMGVLSNFSYAPYGYYNSNAPQGDAVRIDNYVRLVRDASTVPEPSTAILLFVVSACGLGTWLRRRFG